MNHRHNVPLKCPHLCPDQPLEVTGALCNVVRGESWGWFPQKKKEKAPQPERATRRKPSSLARVTVIS